MSAVAVDRLHSGSAGPPPLQQAAWKPNILSLRTAGRQNRQGTCWQAMPPTSHNNQG